MVDIAAGPRQQIRPAFVVRKLNGKRKQIIYTFDAKGQKVGKEVELDAGYLVKFPKGHSIRVTNEASLKRLGFDQTVPLIDSDNEIVGYIDNPITGGAYDIEQEGVAE